MKIERVYREILFEVLEREIKKLTQRGLSQRCEVSLSTVNHAIKPLVRMNAVEVSKFGLRVTQPKKILYYWACIRRLEGDVVYKTFLREDVERIETTLPPGSILTAYSAFKLRFREVPSEYGEVVVYGRREDFLERFGKENLKFEPNLIVLKLDEHLLKFKEIPVAQIFVDLWSLRSWYANVFLKRLEVRIDGILERMGYR
ncbi:MAG: hypothetical protein J7L59_02130 [Nanoarchaeota archaeon]|nr:hypothetical protein [Nanoarchaeota archaeon]